MNGDLAPPHVKEARCPDGAGAARSHARDVAAGTAVSRPGDLTVAGRVPSDSYTWISGIASAA